LAARAAWREGYSNENTQVAREPTPPPQEEGNNAMQSREDRRSTGQATNDEQDAAEGTGVARRQPVLRERVWEVSQDTSFPTATIEPEEAQSIPEAEPGTEAGVEDLDVIDFDLGLENVEEGYTTTSRR